MRDSASGRASALRVFPAVLTRRADALPLAEKISFEAAWGILPYGSPNSCRKLLARRAVRPHNPPLS